MLRRKTPRSRGYGKKRLVLIAAPVLFLLIGGGTVLAHLGGTTNPSSSSSIDLQKGLVGQWKFDGDAKDSTPYGNNGTVYSATLTTDRKGKANSAYSFNGTSSTIGTPAMTTPGSGTTNQMTICAWVKGTVNQSIVRQQVGGNYIVLGWNGQDILSWDGGTSGLASGVAADNQWHQSCMTWQPNATNGFKSFADGALVTQRNSANTIIPNMSTQFFIGSYLDSSEWENGSIDDVRIYNRSLSAAEITALYTQYDPALKADSGANGLIGWWNLGGNLKDASPYSHNASLNGTANLTTDRKGATNTAYSFDGTSNYIDTQTTYSPTKFTFSTWIYPTSNTGLRTVISDARDCCGTYNGFEFDAFGYGSPQFKVWNGSPTIASGGTLPLNVWSHVAGTYDGSTITLYLNGSSVASTSLSATLGASSSTLKIGTVGTAPGAGLFQGKIGDVRYYNRSLSASEIGILYKSYNSQLSIGGSGAPGSVSLGKGLVGDWAMNGNAKDNTPYGNNGTVNGAALTTDRKGRANSAYSFNGTSDYINLGNPAILPSGLSPRTMCAWGASTMPAGAFQWLAAYGSPGASQAMFIGTLNATLYGGGYGNDITVAIPWTANTWHYTCLTYDGSTAQLYGDGILLNSGSFSWNLVKSVAYIGKQVNGAEYFSGKIDDVSIYNRAIGASEVQALYASYQ